MKELFSLLKQYSIWTAVRETDSLEEEKEKKVIDIEFRPIGTNSHVMYKRNALFCIDIKGNTNNGHLKS